MKYFDWSVEKNEKLKEDRGVSFEEVVSAIFEGKLLSVVDHPNQDQYPGQKIYIVELHDYAYLIPFKEDKEKIFLKTIFPSRKYSKELLEKGGV